MAEVKYAPVTYTPFASAYIPYPISVDAPPPRTAHINAPAAEYLAIKTSCPPEETRLKVAADGSKSTVPLKKPVM